MDLRRCCYYAGGINDSCARHKSKMGWSEVATLLTGVVWANRAINQSERHLTFPLKAGALVPQKIAIIMADLPGTRQERFTAKETLKNLKFFNLNFRP